MDDATPPSSRSPSPQPQEPVQEAQQPPPPRQDVPKPPAPHNNMNDFHAALRSSRRILALCGAGLSAASGLPTFRGAGGLWRNNDATALATPRAFRADPGLVWLFYGYRRHMSLRAEPNAAHRALAALADNMEDFLCLTQNVDGEEPPSGSYLYYVELG
jgi:NAD-dependent SIR2 family protein deacetylase